MLRSFNEDGTDRFKFICLKLIGYTILVLFHLDDSFLVQDPLCMLTRCQESTKVKKYEFSGIMILKKNNTLSLQRLHAE